METLSPIHSSSGFQGSLLPFPRIACLKSRLLTVDQWFNVQHLFQRGPARGFPMTNAGSFCKKNTWVITKSKSIIWESNHIHRISSTINYILYLYGYTYTYSNNLESHTYHGTNLPSPLTESCLARFAAGSTRSTSAGFLGKWYITTSICHWYPWYH